MLNAIAKMKMHWVGLIAGKIKQKVLYPGFIF